MLVGGIRRLHRLIPFAAVDDRELEVRVRWAQQAFRLRERVNNARQYIRCRRRGRHTVRRGDLRRDLRRDLRFFQTFF